VPLGLGRRRTTGTLLIVGILTAGGALALGATNLQRPAAPASAGPPPRFVEESSVSGIDHRYDGEFTHFVGGGVAVMDCDDDGFQDLYLAGGSEPAALFRNESTVGGPLRFERLGDRATDLGAVTGAYPLDIDGDRHVDLAVLRIGGNVLLRGLGDCRFEPGNERWAYESDSGWTAAFSAAWETHASLPTLAFGNYLELDETGRPTPSYACSDNALLRPQGPSAYGPPIVLSPGWCTLSMLFSDWNRSGRRDLRVSNDLHYYGQYSGGQEQLWRVEPGRAPRLYTEAEGWQAVHVEGMGIASQDLTGDGLPEVYLTSQGDNKLQTLADGPEQPRYEDIAIRSGATAHRPYAGGDDRPSTAWHAEFQDVNNDTFMDLFVAKGNVEAQPDFAARDPSNLLLGQPDGTFVEAGDEAGVMTFARGRGAALADLNLDGLLDLVQVNRRVNVGLWRNMGGGDGQASLPMGNWLAVRLEQPAPNVDAIGAWIEVRAGARATVREVTVGGGHAGGQLGWVHFGLGSAERAELRVQWPDGETGPWMHADANAFLVLAPGDVEATRWQPD
jgi:hypothetical protein